MAPPDHIRQLVSTYLLLLLLLLLLCLCITINSYIVHDGEEHGLDIGSVVLNMTQPNICSHSEVPNNSFQIVHRFGPCSPSNSIASNNIDEILRYDIRRVAYLQRQVRSTVGLQQELLQATVPVKAVAIIGSPLFYILVGLGTPRRIQTVDFDTGSSYSWIQCRPCQPCKRQQDPLFDPTLSHSYHTVSCNDPACTQLPYNIRGCINNKCTYNIVYADLDFSKGILSRERLSLPTFVGDRFPNFVFGCGHQNVVNSVHNAGIFGLGRNFHSLVTQTSSQFGHSFSYCLPSSMNVRGYLTLGHNEEAMRAIYTPMLSNPTLNSGLYFINLTSISIDSINLQMPSQVVQRCRTIIDSGSVLTYLPPYMYSQLRDAFRQGMSRYQYQPAPAYAGTDTCYRSSMPRFPYPNITLHFDGHADLVLSFDQVFTFFPKDTYCLAFTPIGQGKLNAIIGSIQQRGIEVIYNIEQGRIGFYRTTNCR